MTRPTFLCHATATILACAIGAIRPAAAQCTLQWQPADPPPYLNGPVAATAVWDPDGAGPATALLVVGGDNLAGGPVTTAGIAAYDGTQWLPMGTPPSYIVTSMTVYNGQLVAAFSTLGTSYSQFVSSWNGLVWSLLGALPAGEVKAMTVFGGELIVAGDFDYINTTALSKIARWNGTTWSALGAGVAGVVRAMAVYSNALYVGGDLSSAGGSALDNLARWSGTNWTPVGNPNGTVWTLGVRTTMSAATSHLFAGGTFTSIGGFAAQRIALYNAAANAWTAFGAGLPGTNCRALFVRGIGLSGYELTAAVENGSAPHRVLRWSASVWNGVGADLAEAPRALAYFGGRFLLGVHGPRTSLQAYDGTNWVPVTGPGLTGPVLAILDLGSDVVIGGSFPSISGVTMNGIARGNVGAWSALGSGVAGSVRALARAANGDVIAGGDFAAAGGQPAANIARWNGSVWAPLGPGTNGPVHAVAVLTNGELVVGGAFTQAGGVPANRVARWNGSAWTAVGTGTNDVVRAVLPMANGDLVLGGDFTTAGGLSVMRITRTNGIIWSPYGSGMDAPVFALTINATGDIVAGGAFNFAGGAYAPGAARWTGVYWDRFTIGVGGQLSGDVHALAVLPNREPIAGGAPSSFIFSSSNLARSRDKTWTSLQVVGDDVNAIAVRANGEVLVGGQFTAVSGQAAGNFARLITPCPATTVAYGSGCAGSTGVLSLAATAQPWVGSTYRGRATGFAPGSLALDLLGFSAAAVSLTAVHPTAGPGCSLLVSPVVFQLSVPVAGAADVQFDVPVDPALQGTVLREQVLQIELGPTLDIVGMSTSNGLELTVGFF